MHAISCTAATGQPATIPGWTQAGRPRRVLTWLVAALGDSFPPLGLATSRLGCSVLPLNHGVAAHAPSTFSLGVDTMLTKRTVTSRRSAPLSSAVGYTLWNCRYVRPVLAPRETQIDR
jgi:hypothetical protein